MGLFGKKQRCPICGQPVRGVFKLRIKDKVALCSDCAVKVSMDINKIPFQSVEDIQKHFAYRDQNKVIFDSFNVSRELPAGNTVIRVDDEKKLWYTDLKKYYSKNPEIFRFDEIIDYELSEDGDTVSKGGIGSAIAGGMLFGDVGAVVGGVTGKKRTKTVIESMKLRVSLRNPYTTSLSMEFIKSALTCKTGGIIYNDCKREAEEVIALFDYMCDITAKAAAPSYGADEIMKFKQLLDCGAITQEEYAAKKKQILGL